MDIWETSNLILFIGFVIPGFIAIKFYELLIPSSQVDSKKQIIDAIAYSCFNYAIWIGPILSIEASSLRGNYPIVYTGFYMVVLFGSPIIMALLWRAIRTSRAFQTAAAHPTLKPWDYVFFQKKSYWIKITLKDGSKIGGKYSDQSFSSSFPAEEQIFLEESWVINLEGGFERPKNRTAGILIFGSEVACLEFFDYWEVS